MPSEPPSRPMPEYLMPPKGASAAARANELMPTIPDWIRATASLARWGERVKA